MNMEQAKSQIIRFFESYKRMPSYSEATKIFKVASKDSSYKIVQKLIDTGVLKKDKAGKLIPGENLFGIKVLGLVEAGFATPAEENLLDTVTLDDYVIRRKEASFMLRVKGDSMIDAGIREGDMVVVERGTEAKPGQIVVAEVDGAWTMKYLRKEGKSFYLEAANKKYKPIYPKHDLKIAAVVRAVVRRYE
jgi:SOS regulatory protein LexA